MITVEITFTLKKSPFLGGEASVYFLSGALQD
jgi:hypothetical protein